MGLVVMSTRRLEALGLAIGWNGPCAASVRFTAPSLGPAPFNSLTVTWFGAPMSDLHETGDSLQAMLERVDVVDRNAQLLMLEIRAERLKSQQTEAALALVVGFIATTADAAEGYLLHKVAHQLRACAEEPDMAARIAGCEPDIINPLMLRAAASIIFGGEAAAHGQVFPDPPRPVH